MNMLVDVAWMNRDLLWKAVIAGNAMFPALNPFSCHKTVERRHGREWSMTIEDALQIQDDDLRPIEDDL